MMITEEAGIIQVLQQSPQTLYYVTYPVAWQKNIINYYIISLWCSIGTQ